MKHLSRISKSLPIIAYDPPTNIWDVRSWSDIVVGIGLLVQKKMSALLSPINRG